MLKRSPSTDLRTGGRWSLGQRLKNGLIYRLVRLALWVSDRLPARSLTLGGRALGAIAFLVLPGARRRAEQELERALGRNRPSAFSVFVQAGESLLTCLLLRRSMLGALELVDVEESSRRLLETTLAAGRGMVFVSPHLGPFELVAAAVAELGHRPAAVVRESYDPRLDSVVDRHRLARGVEVIHRGAPTAAVRIVRALRSGRPVGFLPDLGARVESRNVRFFGREVLFPIGPQRIALRTGAPIIVGALVPGPGRLTLRMESIDAAHDETELTQRVATALETAIRRWPEAWLWMSEPRTTAPNCRDVVRLQPLRAGR